MGLLKDLNDKGTTIILTTHYLEEAEMLCRNIGIIQHGELVENTSMKALLAEAEIGNLYSRSRTEKSVTEARWLSVSTGRYRDAGS